MKRKIIKFDPNVHYQINATSLILAVILGLIIGIIYKTVSLLFLLPVLSQYQWVTDCVKRVVYRDQIDPLKRLTNSATLGDKRDEYTYGRYRDVVKYELDFTHDDHWLLSIDSNGVTNTKLIRELADQVGAAFHHPAYLQDINNGVVVYWIDMDRIERRINEADF